MITKKIYLGLVLSTAMAGAMVLPGCETTPPTQNQKDALHDDSVAAMNDMKRSAPKLNDQLTNAAGYVIFPNVGKGGAGLGAGYGRGLVYQNNKFIGYADVTMGTAGAQVGAETYSELIVFQNPEAIERFKNNKFEMEAGATAVALRAGASTEADYVHGVAVYTRPVGGLMVDASVGGQNFTFTAANQ